MTTQPPSFAPRNPREPRQPRASHSATEPRQAPAPSPRPHIDDEAAAPERRSVLPTRPAEATPGSSEAASAPPAFPPSIPPRNPRHVSPAPAQGSGLTPPSIRPQQSELQAPIPAVTPAPPSIQPRQRRQPVAPIGQPPAQAPSVQPSPVFQPARPSQATPHAAPRAAFPSQPQTLPRPKQARARRPRGKSRVKRRLLATLVLVALVAVWPAFLVMDANTNMGRVQALSGAGDTAGTTFLLAGSDARANGPIQDDTEGARSDSIMLLNIAPNGQSVALSLPRDTWVDIPGYGEDKLNAAYAFEGPALLVSTVEQLTGLTVDHYVEVGMGGVADIVDAVGGVELCLDYDVNDELSELVWTAGCHVADGRTALAFSRMRYSDPLGDIGRAERQRQVVGKTVKTALSPTTLLWPPSALALERAGARALSVDTDTSAMDMLTMVRAFKAASGDGMTGTPPIESLNYETGSGSAVLLRDETAPDFFVRLRNGSLTQTELQQVVP